MIKNEISLYEEKKWNLGCAQLSDVDPILKKIIESYPKNRMVTHRNALETLIRSIIGQQISIKAAESIWKKVCRHITIVSTKQFASLSVATLTSCGLSKPKALYIKNIVAYFQKSISDSNYFLLKDKKTIETELLSIKGIGQWTVDMFMIFHLCYSDILPITDIGLLNAIKIQYRLEHSNKKDLQHHILELSQHWKPLRTIATWYLWRTIDSKLVVY